MSTSEYGIRTRVDGEFDKVVSQTINALKDQGFGVLSDIDVQETLKNKLDIDFRRYRILGACNPPLAYQALSEEIELGLLLPCNVIVYEIEEGACMVAAVDPVTSLSIVGNTALGPVAEEVRARLKEVLAVLEIHPASA
ncbi:MAG: DUF302 domain-containing protein [candidate division Zixibacteria bacterium]|jgi:uncharacterized protein (DUF302 family)|nr:DUF302 domain-containing protein [candidate division Zixibacteria bacterium]